MDKYAARRVKQEIDRILWEVWDPIGVNQETVARSEYNSYVNGIFELLVSGATDDAIAQHLLRIVNQRMELSGASLTDMRPTVQALRTITLP